MEYAQAACQHRKSDLREVSLRFIRTYRDLPVLWDSSLKEYSNKTIKNEAYDVLLIILKELSKDATLEDVKKKINILRTNYRKECKKIEDSKYLGGKIYQPSCWTFQELSFLQNIVNKDANEMNYYKDNENKNEVKINENESFSNKIFPVQKRKKVSQNLHQSELDLPSGSYSYLTHNNDTEENLIAKTWIIKLQKMKPDQRIFAEKFISDILLEGELGTLGRNSVKINDIFT